MKICVLAVFETTSGQLPGVDEISRTVAEALLKPAHGGLWIWQGDAGIPPPPVIPPDSWRVVFGKMGIYEAPDLSAHRIGDVHAGDIIQGPAIATPAGWIAESRGYVAMVGLEKIT